MTWHKVFNFRATSGYCTDGVDATYVVGDSYPTTRNSVTFGWESGPTGTRDRWNSGVGWDARLAGINFSNNTDVIVFRVDIPATGDLKIRLAHGDHDSDQYNDVELGDNASYTTLLNNVTSHSNKYLDPDGTELTPADWALSNTQITKTMTSTIFRIRLGNLTASTPSSVITCLELEQVEVSGPSNLKTLQGLAKASVKTIQGLAIASVKTKEGLAHFGGRKFVRRPGERIWRHAA